MPVEHLRCQLRCNQSGGEVHLIAGKLHLKLVAELCRADDVLDKRTTGHNHLREHAVVRSQRIDLLLQVGDEVRLVTRSWSDDLEREFDIQQVHSGGIVVLVLHRSFSGHQQRAYHDVHALVGGKECLAVIVVDEVHDFTHSLHLVGCLGGVVLVHQVLQVAKAVNGDLVAVAQVGDFTIPRADFPTLTDRLSTIA